MKTSKNKGGGFEYGLRIGPKNNRKTLFKKSKPGILDGRTCYQIGPIKWCTREQPKTGTNPVNPVNPVRKTIRKTIRKK